MNLTFKTKKLETECNDFKRATRAHGDRRAKLLHQRVRELKASSSLSEMVEFGLGRCHPLKGNYKGKYALDLDHPYRLIVEPVLDAADQTISVNIVKLLEVTDYHGN